MASYNPLSYTDPTGYFWEWAGGLWGGFGGSVESFFRGALDMVGKIWALPNTLVGLAYGGVDTLFGATPVWDSTEGILHFTNMSKWMMPSAMSLGHVIVYGTDPVHFQPTSPRYDGLHTLGQEEMPHTYQAQVPGPLYFPAHIISGMMGLIFDGSWHGPLTGAFSRLFNDDSPALKVG